MNMANELHGSFCAMHLQNYNICKKNPKKQLLKKYGCKCFWAILLMFVFFIPSCFAQGTISVLGGKVFDQHQNVIQGAEVVVTSDDSGTVYRAKTNDSGNWRVDGLIAGHYHFSVSAPNFENLVFPTVELQMAGQKYIDVTLHVGKSTDTVTVTGETPLVDTSAAVSGTVMNNEDFEQIPASTNSPIEFVRLTPGVYLGDMQSGSAFLWSNGSMSNITINGAGSGNAAINYVLDGGTDTRNNNGQISFVPPVDAIKEMRVTTNAYDASIARTAAGTINMTMKSGEKNFSGTLYERDGNNAFNANSYDNNSIKRKKTTIHVNEWGGTFGGPVWLGKYYDGKKRNTFIFASYDGIRNYSPYATGTLSVPTAKERQGDFSESYSTQTVSGVTTQYPIQIYDPLTADTAGERQLFSNATIPTSRISTIAKSIFDLVPLPNKSSDGSSTDSNNYLIDDPKIDKFYQYSIRGDQAWNNNHRTYAEYRHNHFTELGTDVFGPNNPLAGVYQLRINDGITINHVWVMSPSTLMTVNANLSSFKENQYSSSRGLDPEKYGFSSAFAASQSIKGLPNIAGLFTSLGSFFDPMYDNSYEWEIKGALERTYKNHVLHFGAEYMAQQFATATYSDASGYYNFSSIWTTENPFKSAGTGVGSTNAAFLLGLPSSGDVKQDATSFFSQPYMGFYVQNDWRATSKLTLNFGVRWDYQFQLVERHNKYWSRFDPNYNLSAITDYAQPNYANVLGGSASNLGVQLLQSYRFDVSSFVARGAILYAGVNGTSRSITDSQAKYIQPRIGFAYQIHPNTVLRGGLGRFVQGNFVNGHASQLGYTATTTFDATDDGYITPSSSLGDPYPNGLTAVTGNSLGVYTSPGSVGSFYSPDIKRQYTDDASLHLEQQLKDYLFEVGGVFDYTNGLEVGYQINNPSVAAWKAAYGPMFDSTGRPVDTFPGDTKVTNPFKGAPYIINSTGTNKTISAYQLVRPNPLIGGLSETFYNGKSYHYALQTKVQRRMRNGFAITGTFSWSKQMDKTGYRTSSVISQMLQKQLSDNDRRFQIAFAPTYTLPFGKDALIGKNSHGVVNQVIKGWEISAEFIFWSGTPLGLPTNSSFFKGGDPGLGSKKTRKKWFDTSKFVAFPSSNTSYAKVHDSNTYPDWTGISALPGYGWVPSSTDKVTNGVYHDFSTWSTSYPTNYGDVRSPYTNTWNMGIRKAFEIHNAIKLQLRADAYNALNHPRFSSPSTSAGSQYFGVMSGSNTLSQSNDPRAIQLQGKIYF